jgi:hypothetical protein
LIPNPILKVLSTIRKHRVEALLMGGQACVFYGAAEFSRDTDLAILAEDENLARLQGALDDLQAEVIAVPSFDAAYLHAGHAVHFRCKPPEAAGMRVDIMSRMRGVEPFPELWKRRTTLELEDGTHCDLLALPDLVLAKKTQRDKDWPMIRRLVEAHYFNHRDSPNPDQIRFWLQELRTASLLVDTAAKWPDFTKEELCRRPLLSLVIAGDTVALEKALDAEEDREREQDRNYWLPLKQELERLRHDR